MNKLKMNKQKYPTKNQKHFSPRTKYQHWSAIHFLKKKILTAYLPTSRKKKVVKEKNADVLLFPPPPKVTSLSSSDSKLYKDILITLH